MRLANELRRQKIHVEYELKTLDLGCLESHPGRGIIGNDIFYGQTVPLFIIYQVQAASVVAGGYS